MNNNVEERVLQALAARYREWGGGPVMKRGAPSSPYLTGDEIMSATSLEADDVERACELLISRGLIENQISNGFVAGLTEVGQRQLGL